VDAPTTIIRSLESIRRFALFARLACGVYIGLCLVIPSAILAALRLGFRTAGIRENAFMLTIFAVVGLGMLVACGVGYAS